MNRNTSQYLVSSVQRDAAAYACNAQTYATRAKTQYESAWAKAYYTEKAVETQEISAALYAQARQMLAITE